MDPRATILVIVASMMFAIYNLMGGKLQKADWKNRSALVAVASSIMAGTILFGFSFATGGPRLSSGWWFPILATGTLNIGITYAKLRARALEDVSLVTPIDSTTPAVVILTGMIIVGEYPTRLGWLGIWVLVLGTYVLNIQQLREKMLEKSIGGPRWRREARIWLAPFLALGKSAGVRWAFFAVLLSVFSLPYDGLTVRRADIGFGYGCLFFIVAAGNTVIALVKGEHRGVRWKDLGLRGATMGVPFAIGHILVGYAFQMAMVVYVGTMKRFTIPFTIILAYFFLGERKSFRQRMVAGLIMAAGAALIAFGGK